MASRNQCWVDYRVIFYAFPFMAFFYLYTFMAWRQLYLIFWGENASSINLSSKLFNALMTLMVCFGSIWIGAIFFQLFFTNMRKQFVARKVEYQDGVFSLRGWYFKTDSFKDTDVQKVEPYVVSERMFSKDMGTFLSRSNHFTIPSGKNVNWKITLQDGRVFYLAGEMDQVIELKSLLEGLAAQNNASFVGGNS